MTRSWQTIRVFISSTFRDMQAERDHLVRFVFPRVREALARRRVALVDVDLRWGVTADQDALALCLDEIDSCRPRFLCMLGGRYGWVPPGESTSITASEIAYGALEAAHRPSFCHFYFRDETDTASVPPPDAADFREPDGSAAEAALHALKARVWKAVNEPTAGGVLTVTNYRSVWDRQTRRFTGLDEFGAAVYRDLIASVDAECGPAIEAPIGELAAERAAMDAFAEDRAVRYVVGSRQPVLDAMRAHALDRDEGGWLVISGEPGSGKSALMADFWRRVSMESDESGVFAAHIVIAHFAGASAASTSVRRILRRFCGEADRALGGDGLALPDELDGLRDALADRLDRLGRAQPVLLLIDAVDQIAQEAAAGTPLGWLPATLPGGVRAIATVLPGHTLQALRARRPAPDEAVLAPLDNSDRVAIVEAFLARYRKSMDAPQRAALLSKDDSDRPLYLLTALEELRTLGTYEEISQRIADLPLTVAALFDWVLARLENDDGFRDADRGPVGREIAGRYAAYLACGRVGMNEIELAELVAPAQDGRPADPLGNVAALQRLLRPYLMRRGGLVDYFHGQMREAVNARYLATAGRRRLVHREIAAYFAACADPAGDRSWTADHGRGLSELPYHQIEGEMWEDVVATLTDFAFLEAKCRTVDAVTTGSGPDARTTYNGVFALQDDYRRAIERLP